MEPKVAGSTETGSIPGISVEQIAKLDLTSTEAAISSVGDLIWEHQKGSTSVEALASVNAAGLIQKGRTPFESLIGMSEDDYRELSSTEGSALVRSKIKENRFLDRPTFVAKKIGNIWHVIVSDDTGKCKVLSITLPKE